MKEIIAVFIGSGIGGVLRFGLQRFIQAFSVITFPFGTLFINIVACLIIGIILSLADHKQLISPTTRLFLSVGFCGGLSTFSTFTTDMISLFEQNQFFYLFLYLSLSLLLCVAATLLGMWSVQKFV